MLPPARAFARFVFAALGLVAWVSAVQAQEFAPGQLIDSVATRADARQSYALYLPTNFDRSRAWPVIFVFDPGARGRNAVERLRTAAERFGYVVAGSNNSRNGPLEPQHHAMVAMIGDLSQRVPLDPKRVYTAGMSGGSRVALMTALLSGKVRGVLAFSAGLPSGMVLPAEVPFAWFGTAGQTDMNYSEMKQLEADLEAKGATHRLAIFDGGHTWPPAEIVMAGMEWLELEAMRGGVRGKDETFVRAAMAARVAAIPPAPVPARWQALAALARDFKGLADVSAYEKQAKELGASPEVKAWQKSDRKQVGREISLVNGLADAVAQGDTLTMKQRAAELRKMQEGPADSADRLLARRVVTLFSGSMRESVRSLFQQEAFDDAADLLAAMVAFDPTDYQAHFDFARAQGYLGDRKAALAALAEAVKTGYANAAQAASEPAFAKFKDDPAFQALLEKMRTPGGR